MSSLRMAFHPFKGIMLIVNKYAGMECKRKGSELRIEQYKKRQRTELDQEIQEEKKYLMKVIVNHGEKRN